MFLVRLALAALSVGNWGIYGPALELMASTPLHPGSEEYLDSEKYEIRRWNLDDPCSIAPFIRRLNEIRRAEPALARVRPPLVQPIDDAELLAWCRHDPHGGNTILVVVNMQPGQARQGRLALDLGRLGLDGAPAICAHDLLDGGEENWQPGGVTIACTPDAPVRVYRITRGNRPPEPPLA